MSRAHALPTGLGIENEDLEIPLEELPEWEDSKLKVFPVVRFASFLITTLKPSQCWKNPVTGNLHSQVHPCGARGLVVDPLPSGAKREGAVYPDGGEVTDLKEVREMLYRLQRPGIAPEVSTMHFLASKSQVD